MSRPAGKPIRTVTGDPHGEAPPRPLLSVADAARVLGWGLTKTYAAAKRGDLPGVVTVNGRLHVRAAVFRRWLEGDDGLSSTTGIARTGLSSGKGRG